MIIILAGFAALLVAALVFELAAAAINRRNNPPRGKLFDVGGHRLHLHVQGHSGPTVVMESGVGSPGLIWELVVPRVAEFARVVVYDRAGYGWSEPAVGPHSGDRATEELHTLLRKAGLNGPYVLVGHSLGGLYMRIFASRYPNEVAGMVLVDATHEDELTERFPPEHIKGQRLLPKMFRVLSVMSRFGLVRLLATFRMLGSISSLAERFPSESGGLLIRQAIQPSALDAAQREMSEVERSYDMARSGGKLGAMPLVVLMHGQPGPTPPGTSKEVAERIEQLLSNLAHEMAGLSSQGRVVLAEKSGHEIHVHQPELVVEAIRDVIAATP